MLFTFSFLAARRVILGSTESEMPTSGDLNLRTLSFPLPPPPRKFNEPPPHPLPNPVKCGTLFEVLHEVHATKIRDHRFNLTPEIIFVSD